MPRLLARLFFVLAVICFASAISTVEEYKDLLGGTTFEGSCHSASARNSTGTMVCLPEPIQYSFKTVSVLTDGVLYEDYTYYNSTATIQGTEYQWAQIEVTNSKNNVTEVTMTDSNILVARLADTNGFCWWVRINIAEKTYTEFGNYRLDSDEEAPGSCPPRLSSDDSVTPVVSCDGTSFTYLCSGVLTAGEWPSSASSIKSFLFSFLALFI